MKISYFLLYIFVIIILSPVHAMSSEIEKQACMAIKKSNLVKITYVGDASLENCKNRVIEPYQLGLGYNKKKYLYGYQVAGCSNSGVLPDFRTFRLDKIIHLEESDSFLSDESKKRKNLPWLAEYKGVKYVEEILCN